MRRCWDIQITAAVQRRGLFEQLRNLTFRKTPVSGVHYLDHIRPRTGQTQPLPVDVDESLGLEPALDCRTVAVLRFPLRILP